MVRETLANDEFHEKTSRPNQPWQTDFIYLKVIGWGWFYLSTILDDYRYIIAWCLCTTMRTGDVTTTLEDALAASGCDSAVVAHRPRLLTDNGSSYISGDLAAWLEGGGIDHVRGAPNHPQTQGKIERWHQKLKNRILLEKYYLPGALEEATTAFVAHYNHQRYHESLGNLTPADVYFGRAETILRQRKEIKAKTIETRRLARTVMSSSLRRGTGSRVVASETRNFARPCQITRNMSASPTISLTQESEKRAGSGSSLCLDYLSASGRLGHTLAL